MSSATAPIPTSDELVAPLTPELELCYQTFGEPDGEALLLIMGLGGPMTWWPRALCESLAERGFFVIRYDNRDTGKSSRVRQRVGKSAVVRAFAGAPAKAPYSMADLADDARRLLDHLGLASAHVAGVSMGGMIAQTLAIDSPDRVRSLVSIMSSTGRRRVGWQHPSLAPSLLGKRGPGRDAYVTDALTTWRLIGSPGFPTTDEDLRDRAGETWDRGVSRSGILRQMLAILTQPDRTKALKGVDVPTAVIHGLADKMVHVSGGRATATAVPGAELVLIDGMGHDIPEQLHPTIADTIRRTADRARPSGR